MQLGPLQQAWVDALRSGKYKQGKKLLRDGDQHCCLGVLCELAVEARVTKRIGSSTDVCGYGDNNVTNFPPSEVQDWIGLRSVQGLIPSTSLTLTTINDHGKPFDEIATIIETYAEELFTEPM